MSGISAATLDALDRIATRARDATHAGLPGAVGSRGDVAGTLPPLPSSDPLAVAAPADAWFVARRADGTRALTRDGSFQLVDGTLRTADGADVLGYPGGEAHGALPVPLRIDETDRHLGRGADLSITGDGVVAYTRPSIDPRTRERAVERVVVGRIALAKLPAGTHPQRLDATNVTAPPGVVPHLGTPSKGPFGGLVTHARDRGAIDLDASLIALSDAYLHLDAIRAAGKARGGVERTVMDLVK